MYTQRMFFWNHSYSSLIENVAADEVLLDWAESSDCGPVIRFWESPEYGVVLGYGNSAAKEVSLAHTSARDIPVVRRCSGGGTVVQGPGCFNYAFVLPVQWDPELNSITGATRWVMGRLQLVFQALASQKLLLPDNPLVGPDRYTVALAGDSDLTINGLKFSGNAQRRRKRYVLFHGTILRSFDIAQITELLCHPSREPGYRHRRSHSEFLTNVGISQSDLVDTLVQFFHAVPLTARFSDQVVTDYVNSRYSTGSWNEKF